LLREAVRLALEGPTPAETGPVQAPLPGSASALLNRLMGEGRSFTSVEEFQSALDAIRERPLEVSRRRRGVQLLFTAPLLALGLFAMFITPLVFVCGRFVERFVLGAQGEVAIQSHLREVLPRRVAGLVARTDPWGQVVAAGLLAEDDLEMRDLSHRLARGDQERELVLQSSSWVSRYLVERLRGGVRKAAQSARPADATPLGLEHPDVPGVRRMLERTDELFEIDPQEYFWSAAAIAFWPALWTAWAFLTRGGVVRGLVGIRLVQSDGRPAARWRCACRSLILWLPVVLLLWLATSIDLARISHAHAASSYGGNSLAALTAWACWWLALGLLPLYVWLAHRSPERSLSDRVAGTYLVPR
jgi:hypothetical protein